MMKKLILSLFTLLGLTHFAAGFTYYESPVPVSSSTAFSKFSQMGIAGSFRFYSSSIPSNQQVVMVLSSTGGIQGQFAVFTGTMTAQKYFGDGSALTGLPGGSGTTIGILKNGVFQLRASTINTTGDIQVMTSISSVTWRVDLSTLQNQTANLDLSTAVLTVRIGNLDLSTAALTTILTNLNLSTAVLTIRLGNLDSSTATLTTRLNNVNTSTANLTTRLNNLDTATGTITSNFNGSTLAIAGRLTNLDGSTATLTGRLNALDVSTAALTVRASNLDLSTAAILASLNASSAAILIRAANLDTSTAALTIRINNLDSSTATNTTRLNNLDISTAGFLNLNTATAALTTRVNNLDISTRSLTLIGGNSNYVLIGTSLQAGGMHTASGTIDQLSASGVAVGNARSANVPLYVSTIAGADGILLEAVTSSTGSPYIKVISKDQGLGYPFRIGVNSNGVTPTEDTLDFDDSIANHVLRIGQFTKRVGVNTSTSPKNMFEVAQGSFVVTDGGYVGIGRIPTQSPQLLRLHVGEPSSTAIGVSTNAQVGIGHGDPSSLLDISGGSVTIRNGGGINVTGGAARLPLTFVSSLSVTGSITSTTSVITSSLVVNSATTSINGVSYYWPTSFSPGNCLTIAAGGIVSWVPCASAGGGRIGVYNGTSFVVGATSITFTGSAIGSVQSQNSMATVTINASVLPFPDGATNYVSLSTPATVQMGAFNIASGSIRNLLSATSIYVQRLGVNTTAPMSLVDIRSDGVQNTIFIQALSTPADNTAYGSPQMQFWGRWDSDSSAVVTASGAFMGVGVTQDATGSPTFSTNRFSIKNNQGKEIMYLHQLGEVGINTAQGPLGQNNHFVIADTTLTVARNGQVIIGGRTPSSKFDLLDGSITVRGTNAGIISSGAIRGGQFIGDGSGLFNTLSVSDEGGFLAMVSSMNCTGTGIDCSVAGGTLTINVVGGGGGGGGGALGILQNGVFKVSAASVNLTGDILLQTHVTSATLRVDLSTINTRASNLDASTRALQSQVYVIVSSNLASNLRISSLSVVGSITSTTSVITSSMVILTATTSFNGVGYYWPATLTGGNCLKVDAAGNLTWGTCGSGGGGSGLPLPEGATNYVQNSTAPSSAVINITSGSASLFFPNAETVYTTGTTGNLIFTNRIQRSGSAWFGGDNGVNLGYNSMGSGAFLNNQVYNPDLANFAPSPANGAVDTTIGGGEQNRALAAYATIGGGFVNLIYGLAGTIAGGESNQIIYRVTDATICGGNNNIIYNAGSEATICGGNSNKASGRDSFIGGGIVNTTSGPYTSILGGYVNTASSQSAVVLGGENNQVLGNNSIAAGEYMVLHGQRSFLWGHATADTISYSSDAFMIYTGSVAIGNLSPSSKFDLLNGSVSIRGTNAGIASSGTIRGDEFFGNGRGLTNTLSAYDEGTFQTMVSSINCVGAGIACGGSGQTLTITVPGGGGGGGSTPGWYQNGTFKLNAGSVNVTGDIQIVGTDASSITLRVDLSTGNTRLDNLDSSTRTLQSQIWTIISSNSAIFPAIAGSTQVLQSQIFNIASTNAAILQSQISNIKSTNAVILQSQISTILSTNAAAIMSQIYNVTSTNAVIFQSQIENIKSTNAVILQSQISNIVGTNVVTSAILSISSLSVLGTYSSTSGVVAGTGTFSNIMVTTLTVTSTATINGIFMLRSSITLQGAMVSSAVAQAFNAANLQATNSPSDTFVWKYDAATGKGTWSADNNSGGGTVISSYTGFFQNGSFHTNMSTLNVIGDIQVIGINTSSVTLQVNFSTLTGRIDVAQSMAQNVVSTNAPSILAQIYNITSTNAVILQSQISNIVSTNSAQFETIAGSTRVLFSQHNVILATNAAAVMAQIYNVTSTNAAILQSQISTVLSTNAAAIMAQIYNQVSTNTPIMQSQVTHIVGTNVVTTTVLNFGSMTSLGSITSTSAVIASTGIFNLVTVSTLMVTSSGSVNGLWIIASSITLQGPIVSSVAANAVNAFGLKATNAPSGANVVPKWDGAQSVTWSPDNDTGGAGGAGDSFGNHRATQTIDANGFGMVRLSSLSFAGSVITRSSQKFTAPQFKGTVSSGAGDTSNLCTTTETFVNKINLDYIELQDKTSSYFFWQWEPPDAWDGGTVTVRFKWFMSTGTASTDRFTMQFAAVALSSGDTIDGFAYGSSVTIRDTFQAANRISISSESASITIGNAPTDFDNEYPSVYFRGVRQVNDGADNSGSLLRLTEVSVYFNKRRWYE